MKRGNFKTFVDVISPLKKNYYNFSVYVQLLKNQKFNPYNFSDESLPLYDIEINERDQHEVCFMVRGLIEGKDNEEMSPLNVESFIDRIITVKETCQDHIIVIAQKNIDYDESDEDGEEGDYIIYHLPINEIKTSSNDNKRIFYLNILPFDDKTEHIHYGNIYNSDSEGIIYKNSQK